MNTVKLLGASFLRPLLAVVLLLGMSRAAGAQVQNQASQEEQKQQQNQNQNQADKPALSGVEGSVRPTQAP